MRVLKSQAGLSTELNVELKSQYNQKIRGLTKQAYQFKDSIIGTYTNYSKQGLTSRELERKFVGVTNEQLQEMLNGKLNDIQTDGARYWVIVGDTLYEFKIIDKEKEKTKTTYEVLLDTVEECLERAQKRLDEKFYDWTMKKDILYPNVGKNAMITLEDVIKKRQEQKELERKER